MSTKNILITGGRAPTTLHLCRLLSKDNNVFIAESVDIHISKYSNSVKRSFYVKSPVVDLGKYKEDLLEIIKKEKIDLLIPTCEEIFYISQIKTELEKKCKVLSEDIDKLDLVHNKYTFSNFIKDIGLKSPSSWVVKNKKEACKIIKQNKLKKFVLKPVYSRFSSKVQICDDVNKININDDVDYILQEFIEGKNLCCYAIVNSGKISAYSDYEAEITVGIGTSIFYKYLGNSNLINDVEKIVKNINWNGQIAFDIIETKDNELFFIECNPRLTSGICLFEKEDNIEDVFFGKKNNMITPSCLKPKTIKLLLFMLGWMKVKPMKDWCNLILNSKDTIYMPDDKKPFFMQFVILISNMFDAFKKGISVKEITTIDIEWNGDKRK